MRKIAQLVGLGVTNAANANLQAWKNRGKFNMQKAKTLCLTHFHEHQDRMDYRAGRRAGEPIGSDPIEATCRQMQCRFKRPGQFWSLKGDEALMGLETFWRNGRWHLLFPPTAFNPARN
jgi:hypothetical protein